jgi:hypothetical protein
MIGTSQGQTEIPSGWRRRFSCRVDSEVSKLSPAAIWTASYINEGGDVVRDLRADIAAVVSAADL